MIGIGMNGVVVVTGAAGELGQAMAAALAQNGTTLILADRDTHALKTIAERCREPGAEIHIVEADISDTASARKLVNAAREIAGRIDVWISNADPARSRGLTPDIRAVTPVFARQKRGILINLVSGDALAADLREALSARRDIHLCDVHGAFGGDAGKLARRIADLVRAPRPRVMLGANDNLLDRIVKGGAAAFAALTGVGGLIATLESARIS